MLKVDEAIGYAKWIHEWALNHPGWNTGENLVFGIAVLGTAIYWIIRAGAWVLEVIGRMRENGAILGMWGPVRLAQKIEVRRRQQFSRVLKSDLVMLSKAENWNDQFFTDLEAEVEAEGRYYASGLDRMRLRKSHGLRRASSLMEAISASLDRCLLLVGEPGSGKSTALRHLAYQLAERAIKSRRVACAVPMYVNLRELPPAPADGPTADFINDFVLDNIRRGDSDTADYVREHWDEYKERGNWFFLFDSFDEIPAVLHAPKESGVVQRYAEAIRQFLDGMGDCKGLLASRLFKCPKDMPWPRLTIMPLNRKKQEELVRNTFLSLDQKRVVERYLALDDSVLCSNPLFLALTCRYVKEHNSAPASDQRLIIKHIIRLASRQPDYMLRSYALSPDQLLEGAMQVAALFAENQSLSLSPTWDEIVAAWPVEVEGGQVERLLTALADMKIGRCDVPEARVGERRFAFSNRLYQETLFVEVLAADPSYIQPYNLLTDNRWRDYTVALLQSQPVEMLGGVLDEAERLLGEAMLYKRDVEVLPEFGGQLRYSDWGDDDYARYLLFLVQDGMIGRRSDLPKSFSDKAAALLMSRWGTGDIVDREWVLRLISLLPDNMYAECLRYAAGSRSDWLQRAAFYKSIHLSHIPSDVSDWLVDRLCTELLSADNLASVRKVEAVASRVTEKSGVSVAVNRFARLRGTLPFVLPALIFKVVNLCRRRKVDDDAQPRSKPFVRPCLIDVGESHMFSVGLLYILLAMMGICLVVLGMAHHGPTGVLHVLAIWVGASLSLKSLYNFVL